MSTKVPGAGTSGALGGHFCGRTLDSRSVMPLSPRCSASISGQHRHFCQSCVVECSQCRAATRTTNHSATVPKRTLYETFGSWWSLGTASDLRGNVPVEHPGLDQMPGSCGSGRAPPAMPCQRTTERIRWRCLMSSAVPSRQQGTNHVCTFSGALRQEPTPDIGSCWSLGAADAPERRFPPPSNPSLVDAQWPPPLRTPERSTLTNNFVATTEGAVCTTKR
jgi:hypothetical protein